MILDIYIYTILISLVIILYNNSFSSVSLSFFFRLSLAFSQQHYLTLFVNAQQTNEDNMLCMFAVETWLPRGEVLWEKTTMFFSVPMSFYTHVSTSYVLKYN